MKFIHDQYIRTEIFHSLKLTVRPQFFFHPKKEISPSNYQFAGSMLLCNKRDCNPFFAKDSPRSNPNRSAVHRDVDVFSFEVSSEASTKSTTACDVDQNGFRCLENKSWQIAGCQFCIIFIHIMLSIFLGFSKMESTHILYIQGISSSAKKKLLVFFRQGGPPDPDITWVKSLL